jgi:hypothetical protein
MLGRRGCGMEERSNLARKNLRFNLFVFKAFPFFHLIT